MRFMSSRKFATMEPEERTEVVDSIYKKLEPQITEAINKYLSTITPQVRQTVRDEIGKFAVTENQARSFLDGMILEAAQKAAAYFRPRWIMKLFFLRRLK